MSKITKAIFPVAGLGTRFLPITKAVPKEMLPIIDKPLIHYAVEEAIAAGITDIIFITNQNKAAIENYFDKGFFCGYDLKLKEKFKEIQDLENKILNKANFIYIRQPSPRGLGHAIKCAAQIIKDDPFAVLLPDDLITGNCIKKMISKYNETQSSIVAVESITQEDFNQYGVVYTQEKDFSEYAKITNILEKPGFNLDNPPINPLGVVGRYIFTPEIFSCISKDFSIGKEIQITDAISRLIQKQDVIASQIPGKRFDCGKKVGYLEAIAAFASKYQDVCYT